jgi:hypothetical protein
MTVRVKGELLLVSMIQVLQSREAFQMLFFIKFMTTTSRNLQDLVRNLSDILMKEKRGAEKRLSEDLGEFDSRWSPIQGHEDVVVA